MKTRIWLTAAVVAIATTSIGLTANAATRSERETLEDIALCPAITDAAERLRCFDNVMPKVRAALNRDAEEGDGVSLFGLTFWGDEGNTNVSEPTKPEDFGIENVPAPETETADAGGAAAGDGPAADTRPEIVTSITAGIAETLTAADGKLVFVLDNGQIWRQTDDDRVSQTRRDKVAIIEAGALGSYRMRFEGKNSTFTVRRVK